MTEQLTFPQADRRISGHVHLWDCRDSSLHEAPPRRFVVDFGSLIWQLSRMVRLNQRDGRQTHLTISAGILDALGRGFLIATASVVAGAMFGTAHLAAIGLWTIAVAAASGVGCMIDSALVRNAGCDRSEEKVGGSPRVANVRKVTAAMPVVEATGDVAPEERRARRIMMIGRQREHGTGAGRGV